ncbi:type IV toxin-antitoxin system AbiEi family antitoxin [uncultured Endozoicomonas sp.]|uniref:type IV toxin-antitoxin system AbiEi family antitoxin n=1 Tax=uncultured Endozoicomonas sp. TaxID=432652 RepID=UPI002603C92D|nr:type IV toxin-antitoxin system AbiEi family antitoxin [uncultured Endozoicomonas sp.]
MAAKDNVAQEAWVLEQAIAAYQQLTTQELSIVTSTRDKMPPEVDATVRLPTGITLDVGLKSRVIQGNTGAVIHRLKQMPDPQRSLLVAQYITSKTANTLREAGVQFLDTVGNAYINQPSLFVYVQGLKPEVTGSSERPGKAFKFAGLKVIFALLENPALLNQPYRTIAEQAGVSLGAIGHVLDDLVGQGFMNASKGSGRTILDRRGLMDKWIEAFPLLQRKQHIGTFTTDMALTRESIDLKDFGGWWGGEVAAEHYTQYINPKDVTVYVTKDAMKEVMWALRLRKPKPGEYIQRKVDLYQPFWTEWLQPERAFVHPMVAMAELIATAEPRNLEVAERLYDKYAH